MTDTDPFSPANMANGDDIAAVPDPRSAYLTPADVIADSALSPEAKLRILQQWALELDDRLRAEEEGFSASDPMHNRAEAALAEEASHVQAALRELDPPVV